MRRPSALIQVEDIFNYFILGMLILKWWFWNTHN